MKQNVGFTDKFIRIILAIALIVMFFMNIVSGLLGIYFLVIAGVFLFTSFLSFCPIYSLFRISTCDDKE